MKETPIIFNTENVKAILEGRKIQTRRIIKPQPKGNIVRLDGNGQYNAYLDNVADYTPIKCPYGQVGDRLWVRETHYKYGYWYQDYQTRLTKTGKQKWNFMPVNKGVKYLDTPPVEVKTGISSKVGWYKRSSLFMFYVDARITLEIIGVRVERLHRISLNDIRAEGIPDNRATYNAPIQLEKFTTLWNSLNAKRGYGWDTNPWVWVIEFKKLTS